jgi:hypothetical protein
LRVICDLIARQGNFVGALPFAEEDFNLVAIAYNPVHPKVQNAGLSVTALVIQLRKICVEIFIFYMCMHVPKGIDLHVYIFLHLYVHRNASIII